MVSKRTVLAVDMGSTTVASALASADEPPQVLRVPIRGRAATCYRNELIVGENNEVHRPDYKGEAVSTVRGLTRFIGQPPQVIAGAPYGINAIMDMVLRPALEAAEREIGTEPDALALVVPNHWPDYTVEGYCRAVEAMGLLVEPVTASEAICAAIPSDYAPGFVTCLNLGVQSVALTLANPGTGLHTPDLHLVDPRGGQRAIDAAAITRITRRIDPQFEPTRTWQRRAATVGGRIRRSASKAAPTDVLMVTLPEPFGKVNVQARQINDLVEDLMREVLIRLINNNDVRAAWEEDELAGHPPTLLVAGGFSADRSVATAIRAHVAPWKAHPHPENIPALGAATLIASGKQVRR